MVHKNKWNNWGGEMQNPLSEIKKKKKWVKATMGNYIDALSGTLFKICKIGLYPYILMIWKYKDYAKFAISKSVSVQNPTYLYY